MHTIEPYFNWRGFYTAEEDEHSPFYGREYSEFEFENHIYNYVIHPQWDDMGSPTLFIKLLFVDYDEHFAVMEMIGEWNDAINNDIMILKRDIAEHLMAFGISKFILIGENVLNFHALDDCYYEEWSEELRDGGRGWIALLNFREHVLSEFRKNGLLDYLNSGDELDDMHWRNLTPLQLFQLTERTVLRQGK
ncbi:MAG TPA: hypothetical protein VI112_05735 [Bacteroidia bacterium]